MQQEEVDRGSAVQQLYVFSTTHMQLRTGGVGGGHREVQQCGQVVPDGGGGGDAHEAVHQQRWGVGEVVQVGDAGPAVEASSISTCHVVCNRGA